MFTDFMGDPLLEQVDRITANGFRDKLQVWALEKERTAATADNVIVSVRALFNVARDQGWVSSNPFERLTVAVGGRDKEDREPWTQDELVHLFDDPIWTDYRLPSVRKAGKDAAYWIPLIACFTGARVSEIAQLWTDDLTLTPGSEIIEFRASRERGQRLKNDKTWRAVPMHSELVRLGLPDYASLQQAGPLFPLVPTKGANGAGGQFGQWFGDFKQAKGFPPSVKSMHSFRHLVATELRIKGASEALADAIIGHAGLTTGRKVYSATIRRHAETMRATIEMLSFPGLNLRRVYRSAQG
jgi:integrase